MTILNPCPACYYELTASEVEGAPEKCPGCDAYFSKLAARKERVAAQLHEARARREAGLLKNRWVWLSALTLAVLGYVYASPYLAVSAFESAVVARDAKSMSKRIDYPALRESLKAQVNAAVMNTVSTELEDNPFAAMGAAFASAMIDPMLDSMISPAGLAALMEGASESAGKPFEGATKGYRGPSEFVVSVPGEAGETAEFVFSRSGLNSWKLTAMLVPLDGF